MNNVIKCKRGPLFYFSQIFAVVVMMYIVIVGIECFSIGQKNDFNIDMDKINFLDKLFFGEETLQALEHGSDYQWYLFWQDKYEMIGAYFFIPSLILISLMILLMPIENKLIFKDDKLFFKSGFQRKLLNPYDIVLVELGENNNFTLKTREKTYKFKSIINSKEVCEAVENYKGDR